MTSAAGATELKQLVCYARRLKQKPRDVPSKYKEMHGAVTAFDGRKQDVAGVTSSVIRTLEGARGRFPVTDAFFDSVAFVNRVRDHLGGGDDAYRKFLDLCNGFRQRELSIIDAVEGVEDLLRGQRDLLRDFRAFTLRLKAYDEAAAASGAGAVARPRRLPPPPRASSVPLNMVGAEPAPRRSKRKAACCDNSMSQTTRVAVHRDAEGVPILNSKKVSTAQRHHGEEEEERPSPSSADDVMRPPSTRRRTASFRYKDFVTS